MAVSKLWSVTSRLGQVIDYAANPEKTAADIYTEEQYQALRDVLSYAKDEEKTEREFFVEGINCNPATARDQFISVKKACQYATFSLAHIDTTWPISPLSSKSFKVL